MTLLPENYHIESDGEVLALVKHPSGNNKFESVIHICESMDEMTKYVKQVFEEDA